MGLQGGFMKLKFRADHKDIVAFCWACLLLLYVVAICVVNVYHVADKSVITGWSFNPIPAFFPPYIGYTILFWILSIVLIVTSVSSHFYTREKGFGIVEGKKEDGFGRFAKEEEYKKAPGVEAVQMSAKEATAAGFPLVYDIKKDLVYVDNGESHSLVIGATGSGKTSRVINQQVNLLSKKGESMVISDPKGEIYAMHGEMLRDKGYEVIVVNFRDPQNGSCWNPYTLPYKYYKSGNQDKANELLNDMAINIAVDGKADDPFWTNAAADFLTGLSLGMFEDAKEDEISISTVNLMMTVGDQKLGASTYLKEYFNMKDPASPAAINALGTINAPQDTKNSIDSVLKQKIKVFAVTQNLSEMLSRSDFDMETIGEKKTAVFLIIQDEKTTYHSLATIFVKQCYESLIAVAQRHGGKLPIRTNFLLDEFANMPKFKDITTMITAARSRQIRFTMIIQNFAQLVQTYGKEDAETIRGNCGNILYLLTGELSALEEISKLCGDKIVKVGKDKKEETRPLITVTELQRFKMGEVLVLKHRLPPLKTKIPGYFEIDFGYGKNNCNVPTATFTSHEQQPIKLFDIREYVKKKKEEKRAELFGGKDPFSSNGMNNPFGPNMNNPFGNSMPFGSNPTNPFGGHNPFGNTPNPFSTPTSNPFNANPFGPNNAGNMPSANAPKGQKNDDINIDDLVKKIDAEIAKLEAEEKAQEEAQNKEAVASEKPIIGDLSINEEKKDTKKSPVISSIPKFDLTDDFLEDLSFDMPLTENKDINKAEEKQDEKVVEAEVITPSFEKKEQAKPVYTNTDEINKIMNKEDEKEDDDFFDDFFS